MAEALLRKKAGNVFEASSAGTDPKEEIFPPAIEVMKEIGIDISGQRPKGVDEFLGRVHFEKAIIVCADAGTKCPAIFGSAQRLFWPFEDPVKATGSGEDILAFCRKIRDQIDRKISEWLNQQGLGLS
jgi:arsenate reductase